MKKSLSFVLTFAMLASMTYTPALGAENRRILFPRPIPKLFPMRSVLLNMAPQSLKAKLLRHIGTLYKSAWAKRQKQTAISSNHFRELPPTHYPVLEGRLSYHGTPFSPAKSHRILTP